jgi:hypothetical protein
MKHVLTVLLMILFFPNSGFASGGYLKATPKYEITRNGNGLRMWIGDHFTRFEAGHRVSNNRSVGLVKNPNNCSGGFIKDGRGSTPYVVFVRGRIVGSDVQFNMEFRPERVNAYLENNPEYQFTVHYGKNSDGISIKRETVSGIPYGRIVVHKVYNQEKYLGDSRDENHWDIESISIYGVTCSTIGFVPPDEVLQESGQ